MFRLERFDTYVYARRITVQTDHKPLLAINRKSLAAAPKRLQRMLLRLQRYDFELVFLRSHDMVLSDTLSQAYPPATVDGMSFPEELAFLSTVEADQSNDLKMVASADTIKKISLAAKEDEEYGCLMKEIQTGWPDTVETLPTCLRPYHTFADELTVSCRLVFKGHRFVVPLSVRPYFLERLHSAHIGVNGIQRRARETVYWPGIITAIKQVADECAVCAHFQQSNQKEPLKSHPAPSRPFEKVGVNIFTFENHDYLLTVDYLSGFFEIDRLPSKAVSNIVYCLRQHFSRHGLPLEVVSDNSPFASAEFRRFAERFDFKHTTSSSHYSQSNGRVESAIKVIKRLMRKCRETNEDPFLARLEWRNCPSEQLSPYSPNQLVFGRRTRTLLPTADKLLNTSTSAAVSTSLA